MICFHLIKTTKSKNKKSGLHSCQVAYSKEMPAEMLLKLFNKLLDLSQRVKLINCYLLNGTWYTQAQKKSELLMHSRICGTISKERDLFLFYFNSRINQIIQRLYLVHIAAKMPLAFLLNSTKTLSIPFMEMILILFGATKKERDSVHLNYRKMNLTRSWNLLLIMTVVVLLLLQATLS